MEDLVFSPKQRRVLPSEGLVNNLGQVLIAAHPHKAVGLGTALGQLVPPPLGHAASDQNLLQLTGLFLLHQLLNLRQGLLPGLLEKAAGVDHRSVAALGRQAKLHAGIAAQGHHLLGVHQVFGTAEGDKGYFIRHLLRSCSSSFRALGPQSSSTSAPYRRRASEISDHW